MPLKQSPLIVAGIDVGGDKKGLHAVALKDGAYFAKYSSMKVSDLVSWCRETIRASVIGVDAPCRWSTNGRARPAERELAKEGITCFATPTRRMAMQHPKNHFGWMLNGAEIFKQLETTHSLCTTTSAMNKKSCFETFPHAISCALTGKTLKAKNKRKDRRSILNDNGVNIAELTNIDLVDAALCALAAHFVASGKHCKGYGDPDTGLIIVPTIM